MTTERHNSELSAAHGLWRPAVALLLSVAVSTGLAAQTPASADYQTKAAFLFNFTQFVEWPAAAFRSEQAPLVIGVLGEDPFGAYLDAAVAGQTIAGRPVVVQRYRSAAEAVNCHLLFVSSGDPGRIQSSVAAVQGRAVLTVGDTRDFARLGGMIRFFESDEKVRFQINPDAAREAGLIISCKLLRLAEIYTP
jgi:preprotein translocase subunit Sec61beta